LQKLLNNVLNIFTNITRFSKCGRICNGERDIQKPGKRFSKESLPCSSGTNNEDIAFTEFNIITLAVKVKALVVIIDSN